MNSWAKDLAERLDITLGARVSQLSRTDDKWALKFEDGSEHGGFDHVISAVPSVQAQVLLPDYFSGMDAINAIKAAKMQACFALMVGFDEEHDFGWDSLRVSMRSMILAGTACASAIMSMHGLRSIATNLDGSRPKPP